MIDQTKNARSIFLEIVEQAPLEERAESLDQACGDDQQLRKQVQRLLDAHEEIGSFMDRPAADPFTIDVPITEAPGTVIGPYKLLHKIGEGGFGVVFLAEQERPVRRKVALKVIKPGMDTRQVIARFEAERQALALMDHPNIAKVHDAGATENGRPYFVMELVQGVPITEYCDQCNLTTRERLELFVTVCQAVQHAHQKGVIHRDIKPTNVLVSMQDGRPAPKIIDFGVAKAIGQRLTEHTLTTAFDQMVGSPLYMSPEQAELSPMGVDTRSDIYSLGVMLYELLAGTTPFDEDRLHAVPYDELRRIIREEEPPRPSTRISTLAADLATTVAVRHRTDVRRLEHTIRGELDWIVMKCLEKDRNRRYETPNSLARDIERYLHDEPVQACPPSASYRLKKFVRRNKTLLAAGGAIAAALVIGLGLSTWMYFRERSTAQVAKANEVRAVTESARAVTESARAKAVSDFLQEMLGSADAGNAKGADYKAREILDDFSAGLGNQLTDQPDVAADIHATIGRAYRSLKLPDKAQPHFEKAIELRRHNDGPHSEKLGAILVDYGWNLNDQQRRDEAESQLNEALEIYRGRGITGGPVIHALRALQHVLIMHRRDEDAERVTKEALAVASQSSEEVSDQANLLHRYADLKIRQGHFAEAEQLAHQSVEMHRRLHGDQHPETGWALKTLASALVPQQKLAEAETALRESLAIFRRQFPADHPSIRDTMRDLRSVLEARGDKPALEKLAREEDELKSQPDSPEYQVRLAGLLLRNGTAGKVALEEAHRLIGRAVEAYRRVPIESPNDFRRRMNATDGYNLAIMWCAGVPSFAREVNEMSRLLDAELPQLVVDFPQSSQCQWEIANCYASWGRVLLDHSDYLPTAEHAFSKSTEIFERLSSSIPQRPYLWIWLASAYSFLGDAQWRSGKLEDAEVSFSRWMQIQEKYAEEIKADIEADPVRAVNHELTKEHLRFALFLAMNHREEEAAKFVQRAGDDVKHLTDPVEMANTLYFLAVAQVRLGDEAGYRATCKALVDVPVASADDVIKQHALWTWCLAPAALEDMSLPVNRAEEFVATNRLNQHHFALQTLGAALYRAGRYAEAAERLKESRAAHRGEVPPGYDTINYTRLLLAMNTWKRGHEDEARRLLSETQPAVDAELHTPSISIQRRATLEVLRREAEALIGKVLIDGAKQEENLTHNPSKP